MGKINDYTDIGHSDPRALLWLFKDGYVATVKFDGWRSHEKVFGLIETENSWHGRFDVSTGDCSVLAPLSWTGSTVPQELRDHLTAIFHVIRFHYFSALGIEDFSPNPRKM
jgi:hypothetical protein